MVAAPKLFKTDTDSKADQPDCIFALLGAMPFYWDVLQDRITSDHPDLTAALLKAPANTRTILSSDISDLFTQDVVAERQRAVKDLKWDGARYLLTYPLETFEGETIWIEERGERVSGSGEQAKLIRGALTDVTAQHLSREKLIFENQFDALTGLMKTEPFIGHLKHEIGLNADRADAPICLIVNIENLAAINGLYGHPAGDYCLKIIAEALRNHLPSGHISARLSGSGFASLTPEASIANLTAALNAALFTEALQTPFGDIWLSGVVESRHLTDERLSEEISSLLNTGTPDAEVEGILTQSRTPIAKPETDYSREGILKLLREGRFSLAYQPIVDATLHETIHYESLLRVEISDGEFSSAWQAILAAEKFGLVHVLDMRALELAIKALNAHPDIHLALNISAGTVKHADACAAYLSKLESLGEAVSRLTLELTETLALENSDQANAFAARARELGCRFAIDDFGAGHTSFRNLLNIEADIIKIDGTFIRDIAMRPHQQTFVRLIVDLAHTLGIKTVAEMVDNPSDAKVLKHLDVDYLQGYLFGYPGAIPQA